MGQNQVMGGRGDQVIDMGRFGGALAISVNVGDEEEDMVDGLGEI
jgi:hypothetical protein